MNDANSNKPDTGKAPPESPDTDTPSDTSSGVGGSASARDEPAGREPGREATMSESRDARDNAAAGNRVSGRGGLGALIPKLAFIVSVIAIALAGYVLWQYREFYVALDGTDDRLAAVIEDARASQRQLADDIEAVRGNLAARDLDVSRLEDDIQSVPAEIRALERRIEGVQGGGRLDARESWQRAQAEYYLEVANTELTLGGRWDNAATALELADRVLRSLGDPALSDVRAAIAEELQSLRAVEWPDLEGIALDLNGLIARVSALPMRAESPREFAAERSPLDESEPESEPGLGRLWQSVKGAVSGVIRVQRRGETVPEVLTESGRELVRRTLALELQIARAAAVQQREADFRASLSAAEQMLSRDFNREDAGVAEARRMLNEMAEIDLVPPKPDLSDSLMLLKAAPGAD